MDRSTPQVKTNPLDCSPSSGISGNFIQRYSQLSMLLRHLKHATDEYTALPLAIQFFISRKEKQQHLRQE